jgi:hypothetical protein
MSHRFALFSSRWRLLFGMLLVSLSLYAWQVHRLREGPQAGKVTRPTQTEETSVCALTDVGTRVPVYVMHYTQSANPPNEREFLEDLGLDQDELVTQTALAGPSYNCHGWVFTGGRYHVMGCVELILRENGYQQVNQPRVGDLVVYREGDRITHTGVVVEIGSRGGVLIESKWSLLGRYRHGVASSCFGNGYTYHRSARSGHLLSGIEGAPHGESGGAVPVLQVQ